MASRNKKCITVMQPLLMTDMISKFFIINLKTIIFFNREWKWTLKISILYPPFVVLKFGCQKWQPS